jgi:alpha-galactosidase
MDEERVALVKNEDLLNMSRLGRASRPIDLMSYAPEDGMPSTFLLQESKRTSILTVFNWTDQARQRSIDLGRDLGLQVQGHNRVFDVFDSTTAGQNNVDRLSLQLAPHSVKVLRILDSSVPAAPPSVTIDVPDAAKAGEAVRLSAESDSRAPAVGYTWDFGDGTHSDGARTSHTYTHPGQFTLHLVAQGLDGLPFEKAITIKIDGRIDTRFAPKEKERLSQTQ